MWGMKLLKLSAWDIAYAIDMAIACLITYWVMIFLLPRLVGWHSTSVGVLWAMIATVFVYKDTRTHSLSAGISRLIATFAGFALCLIYLSLLPATTIGMGVIAIGVLLMILIGRRDETGLTAITIAIIMIIAASNPQDAWLQPLLRLVDTLVGIAVGVACKRVASLVIYRIIGEEMR